MKEFIRRIFGVLSAFVILLSVVFSSFAFGSKPDYASKTNFLSWVSEVAPDFVQVVSSSLFSGAFSCPVSEDGCHHASSYLDDFGNGYYRCVCSSCGHTFRGYLKSGTSEHGGGFAGDRGNGKLTAREYDCFVNELPAPGISSDGNLLWRPSITSGSIVSYFTRSDGIAGVTDSGYYSIPFSSSEDVSSQCTYPLEYSIDLSQYRVDFEVSKFRNLNLYAYGSVIVPVTGYYSCPVQVSGYVNHTHNYDVASYPFDCRSTSRILLTGGSVHNFTLRSSSDRICPVSGLLESASGFFESPYFIVEPTEEQDFIDGPVYNIDNRPSSITGGNFGIAGDNGTIVDVSDNSIIVDEVGSKYIDLTTGDISPYVDFSYDYGERAYDLTLDSGDTVTVKYGDEYATVVEREGDRVINNYVLYYVVSDGSGESTPSDAPHVHSWGLMSSVAASCTTVGSKLYTCSGCNETKVETVAVLGHVYQVLRTVTTQYDTDGNLIQQGYTIYQCSRCGGQYKDIDGTGPPVGLPGSGSGGSDSDDNGVCSKICKFLASILDNLISLVQSTTDRLALLVDLFGSFSEALGVLWSWLPADIVSVFVAGVTILVLFAVLKVVAFR